MARNAFLFDFRQAEGLGDRLDLIDGRRLAAIATSVVNDVATEFEAKAVDAGVANINLSKTYVRSKTDLTLATPSSKPVAEIVTRGDLTPVGRFDPTRRIAPGAQRRAGPIAGNRSAGVDVSIRRDGATFEPQWFLLPLKNNPGLFGAFVRDDSIRPSPGALREGKAGKRHIYGPSPYQLFRKQVEVQGPRLERDLADTATRRLVEGMEGALS